MTILDMSLDEWRTLDADTTYAIVMALESGMSVDKLAPTKPTPPEVKYVRDGGLREYIKAEMEARQMPVLDWVVEHLAFGVLLVVSVPIFVVCLPFIIVGWIARRIAS